MIFAPINTTILEFLPLTKLKTTGENERPCFFGLANGMGFHYHALEPSDFHFDSAMTIPIDKLKTVMAVI